MILDKDYKEWLESADRLLTQLIQDCPYTPESLRVAFGSARTEVRIELCRFNRENGNAGWRIGGTQWWLGGAKK